LRCILTDSPRLIEPISILVIIVLEKHWTELMKILSQAG
jgi:hypothetical protein